MYIFFKEKDKSFIVLIIKKVNVWNLLNIYTKLTFFDINSLAVYLTEQ